MLCLCVNRMKIYQGVCGGEVESFSPRDGSPPCIEICYKKDVEGSVIRGMKIRGCEKGRKYKDHKRRVGHTAHY